MANEKQLKWDFVDHLPDLGKMINMNNLRLYALEFPVRLSDKTVYADMLLEDETSSCPMENKMVVLEFKDQEISHGAIDQLNMYLHNAPKQLYRKNGAIGILVSSVGFSVWELQQAKKEGHYCVLFDGKNLKIMNETF